MTTLLLFEDSFHRQSFLRAFKRNTETIAVGLSHTASSRAVEMGLQAFSPESFGCGALDEQIEEESAYASRIWADVCFKRYGSPTFSYEGVDLRIPAIHIMGIVLEPEPYFRRAVRGFRYTQYLIEKIKPDGVILIQDDSVAIQAGYLAAMMEESNSEVCLSLLSGSSIKARCDKLWSYQLKPLLRLGRDMALACNNRLSFRSKYQSTIKVLYFPVYYNRIRLVRSVLEELQNREFMVKIISPSHDRHKGKMLQALEASGFSFSFLNDYFGFRSIGQLLKGQAYNIVKQLSDRPQTKPNKQHIVSLVHYFWNTANACYKANYHYGLARLVEILRNIIEIENPNLLLFNTDEAGLGKVAALLGKLYDIPVMSMDHGLQWDSTRISDMLFDKMAVSGPFAKEAFMKRGATSEQIEITGNPIHDTIYTKLHEPVNTSLLKGIGLDPKRKNILLLTHPVTPWESQQIRIKILRIVIQAIKALPNVNLIIKPHTMEMDGLSKRELDDSGLDRGVVLEDIEKLYDLIHLSDVAITMFASTTTMEAILFGKPVLVLNFTGCLNKLNYAREGAAIECTEPDDVGKTIKDLLYNQDVLDRLQDGRKKFIKQIAYKLDGKAYKRVANIVHEMIEG